MDLVRETECKGEMSDYNI